MELLILEEHDITPGTVYEDRLILGGAVGAVLNEMELHEATSGGINVLKFKGKFQEAESVNKNKRMYPYEVLNTNVLKLQESIDSGGLVGELDHPQDSIIHFEKASHLINRLWWDGKVLMGEGTILTTPAGMILRALLNDGVRVGISSRGVGNGKVNENGVLVIGDSSKLITFDAVADPSTSAAFQEKFVSKKRESVMPVSPEEHNEVVKNEASSLYTYNKELVLACFGGIVQKQAKDIKARL
jgi:hypothetical protein